MSPVFWNRILWEEIHSFLCCGPGRMACPTGTRAIGNKWFINLSKMGRLWKVKITSCSYYNKILILDLKHIWRSKHAIKSCLLSFSQSYWLQIVSQPLNCFFLCYLKVSNYVWEQEGMWPNSVICLATRLRAPGGQGPGVCLSSRSFDKDIDLENLPQCFESTYFFFVNMCVWHVCLCVCVGVGLCGFI